MMRLLRVVGVIILAIVIVGVGLYLLRGVNAERKALEQVIQRQEAQLKEKEMKIQELEAQLQALQKEQVLKERRIAVLRKKREQIHTPQDMSELVDRLRKLGYQDVRVR